VARKKPEKKTSSSLDNLDGVSPVGMDEFTERSIKLHLEFLERTAIALESLSALSVTLEGMETKLEGIEHALKNRES
jgi:hypothetical protein